jgi:hypothetical protein
MELIAPNVFQQQSLYMSSKGWKQQKSMRLMYVFVVNCYQKYKKKLFKTVYVFYISSLLQLFLYMRHNVFMPFTFSFHFHKTQAIFLMPTLASSNDHDVLLNWKKKVKKLELNSWFYSQN